MKCLILWRERVLELENIFILLQIHLTLFMESMMLMQTTIQQLVE